MPDVRPYFYCKYCTQRIVFPFPNREETSEYLHQMPRDTWQAWIQCGNCEQTSLYTSESVLRDPPRRIGGLVPAWVRQRRTDQFYRVVHKCGATHCGLRHIVYVHSTKPIADRPILERAANAIAECPAGHPCSAACELIDAREVFSLL
jgi:hypothetical protein